MATPYRYKRLDDVSACLQDCFGFGRLLGRSRNSSIRSNFFCQGLNIFEQCGVKKYFKRTLWTGQKLSVKIKHHIFVDINSCLLIANVLNEYTRSLFCVFKEFLERWLFRSLALIQVSPMSLTTAFEKNDCGMCKEKGSLGNGRRRVEFQSAAHIKSRPFWSSSQPSV